MARYPKGRVAGLLPMKALEPGEVSTVVRVRSTAEAAAWWKTLTAEERGRHLERVYATVQGQLEREARAQRNAAIRAAWDTGQFKTQQELAADFEVSDATVSKLVGSRVESGKRAGQDDYLEPIVISLLAEGDMTPREFNRRVYAAAQRAGDLRSRDRIVWAIKRIRQEAHRNAEKGQQDTAEGETPQAAPEGQDEARKRLGAALQARKPR